MKKVFIALSLILAFTTNIFCQSEKEESEEKSKITFIDETGIFKLSPVTDSIILGTGAAIFGVNLYLDKVVGFNHIDYRTYDFDIDKITTLDALLMKEYSKPLSYVSYGTLALGALTPAIFVTEPKKQWLTIGVMYAETLLWAECLKETAKTFVIRPRPFMYYDLANAPQDKLEDYDWENSFFSGHTTFAFAAASYTSYLFCQYNPDSKYKYAVIGGSYTLAAATGALRIASGNHFLSDVFVGAVVGTLTGFLVPYYHTAPFWNTNKKVKVGIIPSGIYLTANF